MSDLASCQRREIEALKREYTVIEMTCNPTDVRIS